MKVYSCPKEVPVPAVNYKDFDRDKCAADEKAHQVALTAWLKKAGYTGPHTGSMFHLPVADGSAQYMIGDGPGKKASILIHLAYGDGYSYRGVEHMPKKEILAFVNRDKAVASIFAKGDDWWASRKIGETVHYNNSGGAYVRGVIVLQDGKKQMKPTALVGTWQSYDLPRYLMDGTPYYGHHADSIREGELMQPNNGNMAESTMTGAALKAVQDLPALSLIPPPMSVEAVLLAPLVRLAGNVKAALDNPGESATDEHHRAIAYRLALKKAKALLDDAGV